MITIIAPHPDDEWIGCGCTLLNAFKNKEKVIVLVVTRPPATQRRIKISRNLAKEFGYKIKFLMEPEKNINEEKLIKFLKSNTSAGSKVYIPDEDIHPDHRKISRIARQTLNDYELYQYCVYNNALNPLIRTKNMIVRLFTGKTPSSFRRGYAEFTENYRLSTKNEKILMFGEVKRDKDILRRLK